MPSVVAIRSIAPAFLSAWIGVAAVSARPVPVAAQTTLIATVADASSGEFLPGVEVSVLTLQRSAQTDIFGEVRLSGIAAGQYRVQARGFGYKLEVVDLPFRSADTMRVTFLMTRVATTLDATRVTATSVAPHLSEFESRRSVGTGRYLTEADLAAAAAVDADLGRFIAQRFPGLSAVSGPAGQGTFLFSTRGLRPGPKGGRCPIQAYVDGIRYGAPQEATDLSDLKPQALSGVEFYSEATIPAQYRSGNVCGVLLIWTK